MKKFLLIGALGLALGGCSSTGGLVNPFVNSNGAFSLDTAAIQNAAVAACGFLPTAASVAAIVSAASGGIGGPIISTASQAASEICAAVLPAKSGNLKGPAVVRGVVVHGKFVHEKIVH